MPSGLLAGTLGKYGDIERVGLKDDTVTAQKLTL